MSCKQNLSKYIKLIDHSHEIRTVCKTLSRDTGEQFLTVVYFVHTASNFNTENVTYIIYFIVASLMAEINRGPIWSKQIQYEASIIPKCQIFLIV